MSPEERRDSRGAEGARALPVERSAEGTSLLPRVLRAYRRSVVPCVVLAAVVFAGLYLTVLPRPGVKIDLVRAKAIVAAQWLVPVMMVHAWLVIAGLVQPWVRGDRPGRAAIAGLTAIPAVWIHVVVAQGLVVLGLIAGVVPGVLALGVAALVAAAVADGARGREAFPLASAATAPRRWPIAVVVLLAIALELGVTIALWKALVPPLGKKTPVAGLLATSRFAWINAIRAAITAPLIGTLFSAFYARGTSGTPQPASAARTAAASPHAATS